MKRQKLIIVAILGLTLCISGIASAQGKMGELRAESTETPGIKWEPFVPNENYEPGLWEEPANKFEPYIPNEQFDPIPSQGVAIKQPELLPIPPQPGGEIDPVGYQERDPGVVNEGDPLFVNERAPVGMNEEDPLYANEQAPKMLQPGPSSPQFTPVEPPRGVTPVPPPEQGGGWAEGGKRLIRWFMDLKNWDRSN